MKRLQETLNAAKVDQALESVKPLASRPKDLIDPFALLASLEQLVDCARESDHTDRKKFKAIFKKCHPLVYFPNMACVVIHLLGDKEDKDVMQQISKILKSSPTQMAFSPPWDTAASRPPLSSFSGSRVFREIKLVTWRIIFL